MLTGSSERAGKTETGVWRDALSSVHTLRTAHRYNNKKAVLPQGNRAMPQVFFSVEVRQQHSLQV